MYADRAHLAVRTEARNTGVTKMERNKLFDDNFVLPEYPNRIFRGQRGCERLLKLGDNVFYPKYQTIVSPGDTIPYCFLVKEGRVMSIEYTPGGSEHVFNLYEEGSMFLESNLLLNIPSAVYFQTLLPSELIRITQANLSKAMMADYEITLDIVRSISHKYYSAMDQVRENYNHNATWKVYNMLLILAENFGTYRDNRIMINLKVSQQMLSNLLGINRITTVKIIKEMKDTELIEQVNGFYCIRDIDRLRQYKKQAGAIGE